MVERRRQARRIKAAPPTEQQPVAPAVHPSDEAAVVAWMLEGLGEHEIVSRLIQKRDGDPVPVLQAAFKHFLRVGTIEGNALQATFGFVIEGTRKIYQLLLADGDLRGALQALRYLMNFVERASALGSPAGPGDPGDDPGEPTEDDDT